MICGACSTSTECIETMDQQKRFLLAMVLSTGILFGWQYFFAPPPPEASPDQIAKGADVAAPGADKAAPEVTPDPAQPPVVVKQVAVEASSIKTDRFTLAFSNRGGQLTGIQISKPEQYAKAGDLLANFPDDSRHFPFDAVFLKGQVALPDNLVYEIVPPDAAQGEGIHYRYVDPAGAFQLDKIFSVDPANPYALKLDVKVVNRGQKTLQDGLALDMYGYHDPKAKESKSFLDFTPDQLEGICRLSDDTERKLYDALKKPEIHGEASVWGSVGSRYFFWAAVPDGGAVGCSMERVDEDYLRTRLTQKEFALGPGEAYRSSNLVYIGPKDLDVLDTIGHDLTESVDYGMLTVLARPMRWLLVFFNNYVHNWGLAIILLTLLIKILTWPINDKSYASAERMKDIQPKLAELKVKYENDQQRLSEETMRLFSESGFNPAAGCLPMFLQMPILYGLYVMIMYSVELYQASFLLWYTDLSVRDPYFVLPGLMCLVMVIQMRFTPTDNSNPQAATMMKIMPVMFTAFMLFLPSGLVLYYLVNQLLSLIQQFLIRRKYNARREAAAAAAAGPQLVQD
jgi:YidC/Oxa1 family membrane protein insertase